MATPASAQCRHRTSENSTLSATVVLGQQVAIEGDEGLAKTLAEVVQEAAKLPAGM
jgi:hypothetical protein